MRTFSKISILLLGTVLSACSAVTRVEEIGDGPRRLTDLHALTRPHPADNRVQGRASVHIHVVSQWLHDIHRNVQETVRIDCAACRSTRGRSHTDAAVRLARSAADERLFRAIDPTEPRTPADSVASSPNRHRQVVTPNPLKTSQEKP